jgi:ketosteroid isomerase-like protein
MIKSRANVQAFWTKAAEAIEAHGGREGAGADAAREIGTFALTTNGGQPQHLTGKYVVVWQEGGSDWKLATDIWHSDM